MNARRPKKFILVILSVLLISAAFSSASFAEEETGAGKLLNGSFEDGFAKDKFSSSYYQFIPDDEFYWKTTAEEKKVELFKKNTGTYIAGVTLEPSDGTYAAELNADEESSLYQIVDTEPSSLYEWGLDHGARTESETMAVIIGPEQPVDPSKNLGEGNGSGPTYKSGRDQTMQMIDWLKETGNIDSTLENTGIANEGQAIIVYSKKFAARGGFENNQDNEPFSMVPSSIYTEKWCIWLITDHNKKVDDDNKLVWGKYGLNAQSKSEQSSEGEVDLSEYYLYTVPSGQTRTLFAFTSVETSNPPGKNQPDPTYGNFIDNIQFNLYRKLSGSTTLHGSAVVGTSDGTTSGEGAVEGHEITIDHNLTTYVADGENLKIEGRIPKADIKDVSFAGVYYTVPDGAGSVTRFIQNNDDWKVIDSGEYVLYTYTLGNVNSAVNLHFVFIKSPMVTYDVNGGKDPAKGSDQYYCTDSGSNSDDEASNVYSFRPISSETGIQYIEPYTSHAPVGQNDGWKFMGWQLFDDTGAVDGLLPGVHKIACNYQQRDEDANLKPTQKFVVIGKDGTFMQATGDEGQNTNGISWTVSPAETVRLYDKDATGLTLVAQWRWKQTFTSQVNTGSGYTDSSDCGSIIIKDVPSDDYEVSGASNSYYAELNERVTVIASAKEGYIFEGWYDKEGKQVSANAEFSYIESKGALNEYYARFSATIPQHFRRQIKADDVWKTLGINDETVPLLDRSDISEKINTTVSSTASNNSQYAFIGWYDGEGDSANKVDSSLLSSNGKTIRYSIAGEKTYYARYEEAQSISFRMQYVHDGSETVYDSEQNFGLLSEYDVSAANGDAVTCKAYVKAGYNFLGWYDSKGEKVTTNATITREVNGPNVYYAKYEPKSTTYNVEYYKVSADETTAVKDDGMDETINGFTGDFVSATVKKITGYTYQAGFNKNGMKTVANGTIPATGALVLKLYYIPDTDTGYVVKHYKVNSDETAAREVDSDEMTGTTDTLATATVKKYFGYTYQPSYNKNGMQTVASGNILGNGSLVLNLYYTPNNDTLYTVEHYKVDKHGVAEVADIENLEGTTDTTAYASQKTYEGYTFVNQTGDNKSVVSGNIAGDGSLVLKLYYTREMDTLKYMPNGGTGDEYIASGLTHEDIDVLPDMFSRLGYVFKGWNTEADGSGTAYKAGDKYLLTDEEDMLYAQWEEVKEEEPAEPDNPDNPDKDAVKSADTADLNIWLMLFVVSAATMGALIGVKRKRG